MSHQTDAMVNVLTVVADHSSVRLAHYQLASTPQRVHHQQQSPIPAADAQILTDFYRQHDTGNPDLVMHRIAHGGTRLTTPCLIDADVEAEIDRLNVLMPPQNRLGLDWVRATREGFGPEARQAASFDTGFYADLPAVATRYALPAGLCREHEIRRYGFHGLAHQSMLHQWRRHGHMDGKGRTISLQLGSSCSITASDHGWPIDTSMGFSTLEGLVMPTCAGDLDPGVVLHLIDHAGFSASELRWILTEASGLRAVAGQSTGIESLLDEDTADANSAIALYCHRARKYLGAYLGVLGGAEAILFGGDVGEHVAVIRARILDRFRWAGIRIDDERNASIHADQPTPIHAHDSDVEIWVTPTDEACVLAHDAQHLLAESSPHLPGNHMQQDSLGLVQ